MKKILICLAVMLGVVGMLGMVAPGAVYAEGGDGSELPSDPGYKAVAMTIDGGGGSSEPPSDPEAVGGGGGGDCTTILPGEWCEGEEGEGIVELLGLILDILTAGVGILATIGLVVSGIQYTMVRDDSGKVAKIKSRIFNIVLGLLAYGVMWVALQWLIPGGVI